MIAKDEILEAYVPACSARRKTGCGRHWNGIIRPEKKTNSWHSTETRDGNKTCYINNGYSIVFSLAFNT
jgi:hypothetical protein